MDRLLEDGAGREVGMETVREEEEGFRLFVRAEGEEEGGDQRPALLPPPAYLGEGAVLSEVTILPEGEVASDVVMAGASDSEPGAAGVLDMSGNHSSEEELEEIITNKRPYIERENKRKWKDLSQSESSCESDPEGWEEPELRPQQGDLEPPTQGQAEVDRSTSTSAGSSSCCDTPSGDEDINHNQPAPVQFSTSPPVDVHKPRRSLSPPPKLFGFSRAAPAVATLGTFSSSLGSLPSMMSTGDSSSSRHKKTISPRKRSRTSRVQHIQRPCLDFEKMQQLRARAVSWRHGGELSLFCW